MNNDINRAKSFRLKAERFVKLVEHHLAFLEKAGGYAESRFRESDDRAQRREFIPFNNAVEVAEPLIFCLLHGIELELKASLIGKPNFKFDHKLPNLIEKFKESEPNSPLLLAVNECVVAIKGLVGDAAGVLGDGGETLANTKIDQWYEDMRYPERRNGTDKPDPLQFNIADEEQWRSFSNAVSRFRDVQR